MRTSRQSRSGWISFLAHLLFICEFGVAKASDQGPRRARTWIGAIIAAGALLLYSFGAVTLGAGATHAETYGLHPDPTAIATLGIVLIALRGAAAWLSLLIPYLWCLAATLTLVAVDAAWAWLPLATALLAALALVAGRSRMTN